MLLEGHGMKNAYLETSELRFWNQDLGGSPCNVLGCSHKDCAIEQKPHWALAGFAHTLRQGCSRLGNGLHTTGCF